MNYTLNNLSNIRRIVVWLFLISLNISCRNTISSEQSVDPSPIAFANKAENNSLNIFLANTEGNIVKQLTHGEDRNFFPAWSPDGKSIAFTSDRGSAKSLYGLILDNWTLVELTEEEIAEPDFHSRKIFLMERGESQVWIMDADGSNQRQLTFDGKNAHPSWSPEGKKIAFSSTRTGLLELFLMDADGSNQKQLTYSTQEPRGIYETFRQLELHYHGLYSHNVETPINMFPTWSPDGKYIAFCSIKKDSYAIWKINTESGEQTRLTYPLGDKFPLANTPSWSPKGDKIAFWSGYHTGSVWVMDPDGSNRIRISDQPDNTSGDEPSWKPDGSKILYSTPRQDVKNGIKSAVWMVNPDGKDNRPYIKNTIPEANRASWRSVYNPD